MFKVKVLDCSRGFWVSVWFGNTKIKEFVWEGGDFEHGEKCYTLRGPYHGEKDYKIYELIEQIATVEVKKDI